MKNFLKITLSILFLLLVSACQSTQKTYGEGLVSVVSQNVVKLAGNSAITQADFSSIKGKPQVKPIGPIGE